MNSVNVPLTDTIAAISTPLGPGGIGIIRLSGPASFDIANTIFQPKKARTDISHRLTYGTIRDPQTGEIADEALVTLMTAPNTYTREDVVEINCHAGTVTLKAVLEIVLKAGARLAEPGEFTRRAFINGRIDLTQAEAVGALIQAGTKRAAKAALRQLAGGLTEKVEAVRLDLLGLLAHLEASIDFADEDVDSLESKVVTETIDRSIERIDALLATSKYGKVLATGMEVAIIGRANVGKSSILNALASTERAIVTSLPGTTRDIVETTININGIPVRLKDTAGIRDPQDVAEAAGVKLSHQAALQADLILLVIDGSVDITADDHRVYESINDRPLIPVVNKCDLPKLCDETILAAETFPQVFLTSTLTGEGLSGLREAIYNFAVDGDNVSDNDVIITNVRHEAALAETINALNEALVAVNGGYSEEVTAELVKEAINSLGVLVGATGYNEILDEIFSRFCIGK